MKFLKLGAQNTKRREVMAMYYLNWTVVALFLLSRSAGGFMGIDQNATCTMDDKTHKAHYNCPDGYEVVYTGEGEKECNGKCYRKGDKDSLRISIERLLIDREMDATSEREKKFAVDTLINQEKVTVIAGTFDGSRERVTIYAPKKGRRDER